MVMIPRIEAAVRMASTVVGDPSSEYLLASPFRTCCRR